MVLKYSAEKKIETSGYSQFISGFLFLGIIKDFPYNIVNYFIFSLEMVVDDQGLVYEVQKYFFAGYIMFDKRTQLENDALISAVVVGKSAVKNTTVDKYNISGICDKFFFVKACVKFTLFYADYFAFFMPVMDHYIAEFIRVCRTVDCDWEIRRSVLYFFLIF